MTKPPKYPFAAMDEGDSIFFPVRGPAQSSKPYKAARSWGYRNGAVFHVRRLTEGARTGIRLWKVKGKADPDADKMGYFIQKDIPIPKRGNYKPNQYLHIFEAMKVGESHFFEGHTTGTTYGPYSSAMGYQRRECGEVQFKGKTIVQDGVQGLLIWRLK